MNTLVIAQQRRRSRANSIEVAEKVCRLDFAPQPESETPPARPLDVVIDAAGGVFVLVCVFGAAFGLLALPGAH